LFARNFLMSRPWRFSAFTAVVMFLVP
jgi:hypothetical protein